MVLSAVTSEQLSDFVLCQHLVAFQVFV